MISALLQFRQFKANNLTIRLLFSKAMEELRLNRNLIRILCGGILPVDYPFHQDQEVAQVSSETSTTRSISSVRCRQASYEATNVT